MSMLGFGFGTPPRIERPDRQHMATLARAYIAAVDTYDACAESRTAENWEAYLVANEAWRAVLAQQRKWEDQQDVRTLAVVLLADVERLRIRPENDKARYGRDQGAADALAARRAPTKGKVKAD